MTTVEFERGEGVPDSIARQLILPEGHRDEGALYEAYHWLRTHEPLAQASIDGYPTYWLVSKHADIMAIERDWQLFSSAGIDGTGFTAMLADHASIESMQAMIAEGPQKIVTVTPLDPPLLKEIRDIVNDWFRPLKLRERESAFRELVRKAIDERLQPGVNEFDFVKDFAVYYPLRVIMTLLGFPAEDESKMMTLTQEFFGPADPDLQRHSDDDTGVAAPAMSQGTMFDFQAHFDDIIDDRRANPRDDLASTIANARDESGELYGREFARGWYLAIATAGHDTTSSTLSSIIEALALNPNQLSAVQADTTRVPDLVHEGLRWASPVKQFVRQATRDTELRGKQIKRGDRLALLYPSANRDEEVFEDPNTFKFDRKPNRHIAFGFGPHMCIGQNLAKLELRIMLEELLPRIASLEVVGKRRCVLSNFVGGLKNLPIRLKLLPRT